jgi:hypothetical protein
MPIKFTVYSNDGYYVSKSIGSITDTEMLDDYGRFFASDEWIPGMNELADISETDVAQITKDGVKDLAGLIEGIFRQHETFPRVAVYAPNDLPYGLSRMYSVEAERFESIKVFRDLDEARAWLRDGVEKGE